MRRSNLAAFHAGLSLPGHRVGSGGVATLEPGETSHPEGRHVHDTPEVFLILEGRGRILTDGAPVAFKAGDVLVVDAGEDHHLEAAETVVTAWLHMAAG